jgi:hypothetical protein
MEESLDRLYELLPVVYRQRDADQGYPLRALLQVIAEQVNVVEADVAQLYENWFIETCQDWVVPYLGDLIGYRLAYEAGEPGEVTTRGGRLRNKILIPRREVANTIRYRRRKGTLALLELLAGDVAGWPARAVEFYRLLGWTQALKHLCLERGRTVDLRQGGALDDLDGPFDAVAHSIDVRRIVSQRTSGRYNIPSVGLFAWRLKTYPVTETPAYCLEEVGPHCFTFSVLGNDTPLYNRPQPETEPTHIAEPINLPIPIRRRAFEAHKSDYYGPGKSLHIWRAARAGGERQPIPAKDIVVADLSGWEYQPRGGQVAVDPELGRITFPQRRFPKAGVWVDYRYAFSADVGGGEYQRPISQPGGSIVYPVCPDRPGCYETINDALQAWGEADPKPPSAVIEITRSGVYTEPLKIELGENESLQIRAASGARPIIRLLDYMADRPDAFSVSGEAGSRLTLDGLLVTGRSIHVYGPGPETQTPGIPPPVDLCAITIRHCTLVPGWTLHSDCEPKRPAEPSLELINTQAQVRIEHSILGSIQVTADEVETDPVAIHISDSILDATDADCDEPACEALGAPGWPTAHAVLSITRSTVFGRIHTHAVELAENSIFMGKIQVARRQRGCLRFCYVTPGSRTPRGYNCQPDLAQAAIEAELRRAAQGQPPQEVTQAEIDSAQERERLRVRPVFNSTRYGTPTYCQLAHACADEITRGADDESEMGVFHDLYQPQRAANLRARLDEYTPAGMEAGIIFAS